MHDFKIGDRVRVVNDKLATNDNGRTGTITKIDNDDPLSIQVKLDETLKYGRKFCYEPDELEKIDAND